MSMIYFIILIFIKTIYVMEPYAGRGLPLYPWFWKQKFVVLDAEPGMVVDDVLIKQRYFLLLGFFFFALKPLERLKT